MAKLQQEFNKFEDNIRLSDIDDNKPLREKRDMLIDELREWGKKNDKPNFDWFNQGSYDMSMGIKPQEEDDHDIDVAIVYNINIDDYEDPTEVKKWFIDALKKGKREVTIMTSCVRVQYREDGELKYHVDFAIYGKELDDEGEEIQKYLAKGKEFAAKENRFWQEAEPKKLKKLIKEDMFKDDEKLGGEKRAEYRRIGRYFKRWKDHNFTSDGNARPTGISKVAICYEWFVPQVKKNWEGKVEKTDIISFKETVRRTIDNNHGLDVELPVKPHNKLFEKLQRRENNTKNYKEKLADLFQALSDAYDEPDPHEAAKILEKVLGPDFPIPEKENTAKSTAAPAITTSSVNG